MVWGEPMMVDGDEVNVVFVDTEGFEATGMSDAYDDRICAILHHNKRLVYNLPETVKEGTSRSIVAVELAQEFYKCQRQEAETAETAHSTRSMWRRCQDDRRMVDPRAAGQLASFLPAACPAHSARFPRGVHGQPDGEGGAAIRAEPEPGHPRG